MPCLKTDGSFVVGLKRNRDDQVFVRVLTEAVHGFGKQVVAEFVEDGKTLDILQGHGVDYAQGNTIGRPSSRPVVRLSARCEAPEPALRATLEAGRKRLIYAPSHPRGDSPS